MSSRKRINEEAVTNELRAGSLFFRPPQTDVTELETPASETTQPGPVASADTDASSQSATAPVTTVRSSVRTAVRVATRVLKRHPFEFYQDQLDQLKQISLNDQMAGGRGNMSEMVREAVDAWLAKRREGERV
jgi:hypothetical protein